MTADDLFERASALLALYVPPIRLLVHGLMARQIASREHLSYIGGYSLIVRGRELRLAPTSTWIQDLHLVRS